MRVAEDKTAAAGTALEEFAAALGVTATVDELGIRATLIALTERVGGHPAVPPGRVRQATVRRLRETLAAPGR